MLKLSHVWIFSDSESRYPELIAGGLQLANKVNVILAGGQEQAAQAFSYGAHCVYCLNKKNDAMLIEDYAQTMAQLIAQSDQPTLVLMSNGKRCKTLVAKLGVLLKAGVVNDVSRITLEEGGISSTHMVYGGLALSEEKITSPIAVMTLTSGVYEASPADTSQPGEVIQVDFVKPLHNIKCIERRAKQSVHVDLGQARQVVGIGRGIAAQDDIQLIESLCAAIGAEIGCSRPIAEGEKWMERDRYIGVSGVMLKPDVYLALGISGQIQHMVGVNSAHTIIAINKDKNAPIFQHTDYGLVGDLYKVVPALINAFKN